MNQLEKMFSVKEKVVLISGSGGLAIGLAEGYESFGAKVIVTSHSMSKVQNLLKDYQDQKKKIDVKYLDLSDKESIVTLIQDVVRDYGKIDTLIHTAILWKGFDAREDQDELLKAQMDANIVGTTELIRETANSMVQLGVPGKIININSTSAKFTSTWQGYAYGISKAAMTRMTNYYAMLYALKDICVNEIAPIWIDTPMMKNYSPEYKERFANQVPKRKVTVPEDYLGLCMFLSAGASQMITGQTFTVDGGWSGCRINEWPENIWK